MRIVILRGPDQFSRDLYTRLLVEALEQVHGEIDQFAFDGYWLDVGRLDDYEKANRDFGKL